MTYLNVEATGDNTCVITIIAKSSGITEALYEGLREIKREIIRAERITDNSKPVRQLSGNRV